MLCEIIFKKKTIIIEQTKHGLTRKRERYNFVLFSNGIFHGNCIEIQNHFELSDYKKLTAEYENLRKAILENNVNITKRIINDLNVDKEIVINFTPKVDNSLLFM